MKARLALLVLASLVMVLAQEGVSAPERNFENNGEEDKESLQKVDGNNQSDLKNLEVEAKDGLEQQQNKVKRDEKASRTGDKDKMKTLEEQTTGNYEEGVKDVKINENDERQQGSIEDGLEGVDRVGEVEQVLNSQDDGKKEDFETHLGDTSANEVLKDAQVPNTDSSYSNEEAKNVLNEDGIFNEADEKIEQENLEIIQNAQLNEVDPEKDSVISGNQELGHESFNSDQVPKDDSVLQENSPIDSDEDNPHDHYDPNIHDQGIHSHHTHDHSGHQGCSHGHQNPNSSEFNEINEDNQSSTSPNKLNPDPITSSSTEPEEEAQSPFNQSDLNPTKSESEADSDTELNSSSKDAYSDSIQEKSSFFTQYHQNFESLFLNFQSNYLKHPVLRFYFYLFSLISFFYLLWPSSNMCNFQMNIQKDTNFFNDLLKTVDDESDKTKKIIKEKSAELNRVDQDDLVFNGIFRSLLKIQELETDFQVQVIDSHSEIWNEIEKRNSPLSPPKEVKIPIPLD